MRDLITIAHRDSLNVSVDDSARGDANNIRSNNRTPRSKLTDDEETCRKLHELQLKKSIREQDLSSLSGLGL